jgi:hypothetical protein
VEPCMPQLSRRHVLKLVAGSAFTVPIRLGRIKSASAARGWCLADPVLRIGGQSVHVYIGSEADMLQDATDKIQLRVTVPTGVRGEVREIAADFGKGYRVRFEESSALIATRTHIPIEVRVYAPANTNTLPVTVDIVPVGTGPLTAASTSGVSNFWIALATG